MQDHNTWFGVLPPRVIIIATNRLRDTPYYWYEVLALVFSMIGNNSSWAALGGGG